MATLLLIITPFLALSLLIFAVIVLSNWFWSQPKTKKPEESKPSGNAPDAVTSTQAATSPANTPVTTKTPTDSASSTTVEFDPLAKAILAISNKQHRDLLSENINKKEYAHALRRACFFNYTEVALLLIPLVKNVNLGSPIVKNVNSKNPQPKNQNALHYAAIKGNCEVIAALLKAGAYVNIIDDSGNTPLELASDKGHIKAIRVLIEGGAVTTDAVEQKIKQLKEENQDNADILALVEFLAKPKEKTKISASPYPWLQFYISMFCLNDISKNKVVLNFLTAYKIWHIKIIDLINLCQNYDIDGEEQPSRLIFLVKKVLDDVAKKDLALSSTMITAESEEKLEIITHIMSGLELLSEVLKTPDIKVAFKQSGVISKDYRFEFSCEKSNLPESLTAVSTGDNKYFVVATEVDKFMTFIAQHQSSSSGCFKTSV